MSKKKTNRHEQKTKLRPTLKKHFKALGVSGTNSYLAWCREQGFPAHLDKKRESLEVELVHLHNLRRKVKIRLKFRQCPQRFLEGACKGSILPDEVSNVRWQTALRIISDTPQTRLARESLANLLILVQRKAKFVFESVNFGETPVPYMVALIFIHEYRHKWRRPLAGWAPSTHSLHKQFLSLTHYLFANYPVVEFMHGAWFRKGEVGRRYRQWFLLLASGRNIRDADLPVTMTKKMAHFMMQAPEDVSIENGVVWGRVLGLGGDGRLAKAILGSKVGGNLKHMDFWDSVFRFFVMHPLLDRRHVGPIVDYLIAQKFKVTEAVTGPGIVQCFPPPQPNLSMKKRTPEALLNQVARWHGELAKSTSAAKLFFRKSGVKPFTLKTGKEKDVVWTIREILSGAELIEEGRRMGHCVATYAEACAASKCSIWAMESATEKGVRKHQTIEVNHKKTIVQARGKLNRLPTGSEYAMIKHWASAAGLTISNYVAYQ